MKSFQTKKGMSQQAQAQLNESSSSSRGMEMFESGDGADCVMEVVQDGQEKKVF
jgi:hypothetical protein